MNDARSSTKRLAIFAYGSLLFRPGFDYAERLRAVAHGYARRFTQASPDHRGTPDAPGRVLTLATLSGSSSVGAVYLVDGATDELLRDLDYRERAGYSRSSLRVVTAAGELDAVTWLATPGNEHDVPELPLHELAELVSRSVGPSGRNADYVFRLEAALAELEGDDALITALSALLRR